jgi:hypothetical protein
MKEILKWYNEKKKSASESKEKSDVNVSRRGGKYSGGNGTHSTSGMPKRNFGDALTRRARRLVSRRAV